MARKKRKNGPENGKNNPKIVRKWNLGPIFCRFPGHVSPVFQVRPKSIFRPLFSGPEARNGSKPGPRGIPMS